MPRVWPHQTDQSVLAPGEHYSTRVTVDGAGRHQDHAPPGSSGSSTTRRRYSLESESLTYPPFSPDEAAAPEPVPGPSRHRPASQPDQAGRAERAIGKTERPV